MAQPNIERFNLYFEDLESKKKFKKEDKNKHEKNSVLGNNKPSRHTTTVGRGDKQRKGNNLDTVQSSWAVKKVLAFKILFIYNTNIVVKKLLEYKIMKGNNMSDSKEPVKTNSKKTDKSLLSAILGIGLLLVFVSIAYSVVVIFFGTKGVESKVMTAPAALFDLFIAVVAFSRIFK